MMEFSSAFFYSQVLVFIAILSDILSFQFKQKKYTVICFVISAALISAHY